jgi:hypothetical protein
MASKNRTIVGHPLTPDILIELGALNSLSVTPFSPKGNWTHVYRIWCCHGYRESGNETRGTLTIQRSPSPSEDSFRLDVTQKINNDNGIVHTLRSQILCREDLLATPVRWKTKSEFYDSEGAIVRDLGTEQSGSVQDDSIEIRTLDKKRLLRSSRRITGHWCLLEAVQRMPRGNTAPVSMDILEEMALLQQDHRMVYDREQTFTVDGTPTVLHHCQQWGRGMLPYDYWLDRHGRLQLFTTLSIAYIRDENAERTAV